MLQTEVAIGTYHSLRCLASLSAVPGNLGTKYELRISQFWDQLDDRGSIPKEAKNFSSNLCVKTSFEAHPASYPMGTGVLSQG
jgi:hypothetical protein